LYILSHSHYFSLRLQVLAGFGKEGVVMGAWGVCCCVQLFEDSIG
jgi:hypothetical protein